MDSREIIARATESYITRFLDRRGAARAIERALAEAGLQIRPVEPTDEILKAGQIWLDYCAENHEPPEPRSGWINMNAAYGEPDDG